MVGEGGWGKEEDWRGRRRKRRRWKKRRRIEESRGGSVGQWEKEDGRWRRRSMEEEYEDEEDVRGRRMGR